jgi:hypothetical protein
MSNWTNHLLTSFVSPVVYPLFQRGQVIRKTRKEEEIQSMQERKEPNVLNSVHPESPVFAEGCC